MTGSDDADGSDSAEGTCLGIECFPLETNFGWKFADDSNDASIDSTNDEDSGSEPSRESDDYEQPDLVSDWGSVIEEGENLARRSGSETGIAKGQVLGVGSYFGGGTWFIL